MAKYVIDRFEGDIAVCECEGEGGEMRDIPRAQLPAEAAPGATVVEEAGLFRLDADDTAARAARIAQLAKDVFK